MMAGMRRIHALNFVRTMTVTTVFFLAPLHFMKLGFDGLAIGLIVSLYAAAPILFSFPTGWTNDRLSFLFRFMHEAGDGLMGAFAVLYISRLFEKKTIGGSAGILTALQTSGHMADSLAFSWLGFRAGLILIANAAFSLVALPRD